MTAKVTHSACAGSGRSRTLNTRAFATMVLPKATSISVQENRSASQPAPSARDLVTSSEARQFRGASDCVAAPFAKRANCRARYRRIGIHGNPGSDGESAGRPGVTLRYTIRVHRNSCSRRTKGGAPSCLQRSNRQRRCSVMLGRSELHPTIRRVLSVGRCRNNADRLDLMRAATTAR